MKKHCEPCIRDMNKRIIAWCVGMSQPDIDEFIRQHISEGAHLSHYDIDKGE